MDASRRCPQLYGEEDVPRRTVRMVQADQPVERASGDVTEERRDHFARYVASRRAELGHSQRELAAQAGLTLSMMNAIERGRIGLPSVQKRRALARALRVRHVDLLIAAGELAEGELEAGTPKDFVKYPELQILVERLPAD